MNHLNPPEALHMEDRNLGESWRRWKQRFQLYYVASGLDKKPASVRASTLLHVIGESALEVYNTFTFENERDSRDVEKILEQFEKYCSPRKNITWERHVFNTRNQGSENIDKYVTDLRAQAKLCEFEGLMDSLIRDRIVCGIRDDKCRARLLREVDLTLEKAVDICRSTEIAAAQLGTFSQRTEAAEAAVHAAEATVHAPKRHAQQLQQQRRQQQSHNAFPNQASHGTGNHNAPQQEGRNYNAPQLSHDATCTDCGRLHRPGRAACPARGLECRNCGYKGHYARCCTNKKKKVREVEDTAEETFFVDEASLGDGAWKVKLHVNNNAMEFKIDSGADVSIISPQTFRKMSPQPKLKNSNIQLYSVGRKLNCIGAFRAKITWKKKTHLTTMYVIDGVCRNNLLSRSTSEALGLVRLHLDEVESADVFGEVGLMKCQPVKIKLRSDAEAYSLMTPRRIPTPLKERVKEELDRMEKAGVISPITEPTDWCAPIVPVIKPNNKIRICVDLKRLNASIRRERYILPTMDSIIPELTGAKVFSSLDAASGFWAIPLADESAKLTTFITPFGRYCFRRLCFGISSAPEIFQRTMHELLKNMEGVALYMDDILIYGSSKEEHDRRLAKVLMKIKESGLKLNKAKCKIGVDSLNFLGHRISAQGVQPAEDKVQAIVQFTTPKNKDDLRRFLGMLNYLGKYCPKLSTLIRPLNELLHQDREWIWTETQEKAFQEAKKLLTTAPTLGFFDLQKPTVVSADASSHGLGAALLQEQPDGHLQPIAFASRTLNNAEQKYAQIEKECLASVWACEKFGSFLIGLPSFTLLTDHKPLVPLMMSRDLDQVPARCQRLLIRMMRFSPTVKYVPGKDLVLADALSRAPMPCHPLDSQLAEEVEAYMEMVEKKSVGPEGLNQLRKATDEDKTMQSVIAFTRTGWPKYSKELTPELRKFFELQAHLSVTEDGLLLYDDRIYVPRSQQEMVLTKIHEGHQGITKCRERAKSSVFWTGISEDIQNMVKNCNVCQEQANRQRREPLLPTELPNRPWQKIAADLCELDKKMYLIVTDYYSRYLEIAPMKTTTSQNVIQEMKTLFARWGIPEILVTDNGTQFTSCEFKQFAKNWDFKSITSSPHFPQSNGAAERAVRTAKHILKQVDKELGLLAYRATTIPSLGYSPSQLMMGRRIRTTIPTIEKNLQPEWPWQEELRQRDNLLKIREKDHHDHHHGVKELPKLSPGQLVRGKIGEENWSQPMTVLEETAPRSYLVEGPRGTLRRNRKHLMAIPQRPEPRGEPRQDQDDSPDEAPQPRPLRCSSRVKRPVQRLDI